MAQVCLGELFWVSPNTNSGLLVHGRVAEHEGDACVKNDAIEKYTRSKQTRGNKK